MFRRLKKAYLCSPAAEAVKTINGEIMMHKLYVSLGSNIGDREAHLHAALKRLEVRVGRVTALSAFYATEPWGFRSENGFLNAAACVETLLTPEDALTETQRIERELGRMAKSVDGVYEDRIIDIDLLLYDGLVCSVFTAEGRALTLPHPLMTEREFVLVPLVEIAPQLRHPVSGKTMAELSDALRHRP